MFFSSSVSGRSRRVEGFLAQVFQHRHNHQTFDVVKVDADQRPDLVERFGIQEIPTLIVAERNVIKRRIVSPRGCRELEVELAPWLR